MSEETQKGVVLAGYGAVCVVVGIVLVALADEGAVNSVGRVAAFFGALFVLVGLFRAVRGRSTT